MNTPTNESNDREIILTEAVESIKKKAEDQILRAYFNSVFEMSPIVDRFATWLLAGIGATAALTITNIDKISQILSFTNIKIGLSILTISTLFGFLEKFLALDIHSTSTQETKLRRVLKESSEEYHQRIESMKLLSTVKDIDIKTEVDIKGTLDKFAQAHPWYKRIQLQKFKTVEDTQKDRLRRYYRQLTYTVLEFCGFLLFIILIVVSI